MLTGDRHFQVRTERGDAGPVTVAGTNVTPISQAVTVETAFGRLVWNRPTAVLVERDGRISRVPVIDVTRLAQLALYSLALASALVMIVARRR